MSDNQHDNGRRKFLRASIYGAAGVAAAGGLWYWFRHRTTEHSELKKLALQSPWINDAEFIGYFVGLHEKMYEQAGLEFTYLPGGPDVIADAAVLAGNADIALAPIETVASLVAKQNAPLKIIGTQYQKSPLGVVSLEANGIRSPKDLVGKTLAVPAANILTADALLEMNQIAKESVTIVPYQYDPSPLISGQVDATLDFVTNVPFTIEQKGAKPTSFLLYDFGFKVYNDVIVVTEETLKHRFDELQTWLRVSRAAWELNFADTSMYPSILAESYFKGTGRTIANETYFNKAQRELIEAPQGIFGMTKEAIAENVATLNRIGLTVTESMFDTSVVDSL